MIGLTWYFFGAPFSRGARKWSTKEDEYHADAGRSVRRTRHCVSQMGKRINGTQNGRRHPCGRTNGHGGDPVAVQKSKATGRTRTRSRFNCLSTLREEHQRKGSNEAHRWLCRPWIHCVPVIIQQSCDGS